MVASTGSTTANITPKLLTVTYTGNNRVYDGGVTATVSTADDRLTHYDSGLNAWVNDVLNVNWTASFADKNVGNGKAVSVSGVTLSGDDAANYSVSSTGSTNASITAIDMIEITTPQRVVSGFRPIQRL